MSKPINPQTWANNWGTGVSQAGPAFQSGVQAVTQSPTQAAAAQKDKMVANLVASVNSGAYEAACNKVTTQSWQQRTLQVGAQRFTGSGQTSKANVQQYATQAAPVYQQLQSQIAQMPKNNLQDSIARMTAWATGLNAAKGQLKVK